MSGLRKALGLPFRDWRLLGEASVAVVGIRVGLWLVPFGRLGAALDRIASMRRAATGSAALDPQKVVWAVRAASARVPRATCLTQALATRLMLGRRAIPATLRIGVARSPERSIEAHAWLECRGRVIIGEAEAGRYTTLGGA